MGHSYRVVGEAAGRFHPFLLVDIHNAAEIEDGLSRAAAELRLAGALFRVGVGAHVLKDVETAGRHHSLTGRAIVVVHPKERVPKDLQIVFRESGPLWRLRQVGTDEAFGNV